jgi:hypothetical protein
MVGDITISNAGALLVAAFVAGLLWFMFTVWWLLSVAGSLRRIADAQESRVDLATAEIEGQDD